MCGSCNRRVIPAPSYTYVLFYPQMSDRTEAAEIHPRNKRPAEELKIHHSAAEMEIIRLKVRRPLSSHVMIDSYVLDTFGT